MTTRNQTAAYPEYNGCNLNLFTEEELHSIHYATVEVLREVGIVVGLKEYRDLLRDNGAFVDEKTMVVKFPEFMIDDAVSSAPSRITLFGRDPKNDLALEGKKVYVSTFGQAVKIYNPVTKELRASVKQDLADQAKVTDALDSIDICERSLTANDSPKATAPLHEAEALFPNTTKHAIFGPGNGYRAQKIIDMARVIVGGAEALRERPILTCNCSPTSPLKLDDTLLTGLKATAEAGVPCNLISMVMAGMSGPITLAGSLVVHNAEILASIVIHQLIRRGSPVIYGGSSMAFDLRRTTTPMGSPECALLNSALPNIARYYNMPNFCAGG